MTTEPGRCRSVHVACPDGDQRCVHPADHRASPLHINRSGYAWDNTEAYGALIGAVAAATAIRDRLVPLKAEHEERAELLITADREVSDENQAQADGVQLGIGAAEALLRQLAEHRRRMIPRSDR